MFSESTAAVTVNFWVSNHPVLENGKRHEKFWTLSPPFFLIYLIQKHPKQNERKQNIIGGP